MVQAYKHVGGETATLPEGMTDPLSSEGEETSGKKPRFIGKVVDTAIDSEEYPSEFESEGLTVDLLYEIDVLASEGDDGEFEDREWENQTARWVDVNTTVQTGSPPSTSKWMVLVWHLEQIVEDLVQATGTQDADTTEEYVEGMLDWLEGKTFVFRELDWTEEEPVMEFTAITEGGEQKEVEITPADIQENSTNEMNEFIVPVGKPSEDEIVDLTGEPETGDVEEVDLEDL